MCVLGDSDSDCLVMRGHCTASLCPPWLRPASVLTSDNLHPSSPGLARLARSTIGLSGLSPGPGHRAPMVGPGLPALVRHWGWCVVSCVPVPSAPSPWLAMFVCVHSYVSAPLRSLYHCLRISTTLSSPTALPHLSYHLLETAARYELKTVQFIIDDILHWFMTLQRNSPRETSLLNINERLFTFYLFFKLFLHKLFKKNFSIQKEIRSSNYLYNGLGNFLSLWNRLYNLCKKLKFKANIDGRLLFFQE